jgi:aldose 1-epimerase
MHSATGQQFSLSLSTIAGQMTAVITEVGASLRSLRLGAVDLVQGFPENEMPPKRAGVVLAPWSNRIEDGKWVLDGVDMQLPINEVPLNNAIHGLLLTQPYKVLAQTASSIRLGATIFPVAGYPFVISTEVEYTLRDNGLLVMHTAANRSSVRAPFGLGVHPYFKFGETPVGELTLTSSAKTAQLANARNIPTKRKAVAGNEYDLSGGRRIDTGVLNNDFTDLERDKWGMAHTYLLDENGAGLDIWQDGSFKHVHYFTPNDFPTENGEGWAVAVEPCTAGPNAFNTKDDIIWIEPNRVWNGRWGVDLVATE